jgi:hypothetical protein
MACCLRDGSTRPTCGADRPFDRRWPTSRGRASGALTFLESTFLKFAVASDEESDGTCFDGAVVPFGCGSSPWVVDAIDVAGGFCGGDGRSP